MYNLNLKFGVERHLQLHFYNKYEGVETRSKSWVVFKFILEYSDHCFLTRNNY